MGAASEQCVAARCRVGCQDSQPGGLLTLSMPHSGTRRMGSVTQLVSQRSPAHRPSWPSFAPAGVCGQPAPHAGVQGHGGAAAPQLPGPVRCALLGLLRACHCCEPATADLPTVLPSHEEAVLDTGGSVYCLQVPAGGAE